MAAGVPIGIGRERAGVKGVLDAVAVGIALGGRIGYRAERSAKRRVGPVGLAALVGGSVGVVLRDAEGGSGAVQRRAEVGDRVVGGGSGGGVLEHRDRRITQRRVYNFILENVSAGLEDDEVQHDGEVGNSRGVDAEHAGPNV